MKEADGDLGVDTETKVATTCLFKIIPINKSGLGKRMGQNVYQNKNKNKNKIHTKGPPPKQNPTVKIASYL